MKAEDLKKLSRQMITLRAKNDWSVEKASKMANVSIQTWTYVERSLQGPNRCTEQKIRMLLESEGITDEM